MRSALRLCIVASIIAVGASPAYATPHGHKKHRALSAAKRAPSVELPAKPELEVKAAKPTYWLAADPNVPLAMV